MNQHDQIREALLDVIERSGENFKRQFGFSAEADWIVRDLKATLLDEQALAAEPAPLVRLTYEEVHSFAAEFGDKFEDSYIFNADGRFSVEAFANAIMDTMQEKNK